MWPAPGRLIRVLLHNGLADAAENEAMLVNVLLGQVMVNFSFESG